jgi:hypothetical protein
LICINPTGRDCYDHRVRADLAAKWEGRNMIEHLARDPAWLRPRCKASPVPRLALMIGAALAACASGAVAQQSRGTAASDRIVARQCEVDLRARCDVVGGGKDRDSIRSCMKQQFGSLAEECRPWLARLAALDKACAADVKQNCADVQPGHGRIEACLRSALGKLSDACKDGLARTVSGNR